MRQYVTLDKRSKKARKEYYSRQRHTWGELNPVTRSVPSGKVYNRKKEKHRIGVESRNGFDADFFVLCKSRFNGVEKTSHNIATLMCRAYRKRMFRLILFRLRSRIYSVLFYRFCSQRGKRMGYLSISQTAVKWGISQRRIRTLCVEGRIPGAFKMGAYWSIPDDAEKPKDERIKSGRYIKMDKPTDCGD